MKQSIVSFIKKIFPFIMVIALWRLGHHFWNPGGILAIIPIFYCSFVKKTPYFTIFAVIFCFLIDYNFDTKLFWTTIYCLIYAVNGFQNFINLSVAQNNAIYPFMIFLGCAIVLLSIVHLNWTVLFRMLWMFSWVSLMYIPTTELIKRVSYD